MSLYDEVEDLYYAGYDITYFNRDMELSNEFNDRVARGEYISQEEQSVYDHATVRTMQYNAHLGKLNTNIWERYAEKNQQQNTTALGVDQQIYGYDDQSALVPQVEVNYTNSAGLKSDKFGKAIRNQEDGTFTDKDGNCIMADENGEPILPQDAPQYYAWYKSEVSPNFSIDQQLYIEKTPLIPQVTYINSAGLKSDISGNAIRNQDGTFTDKEGHCIMADEKGNPILPKDEPQYYAWYKFEVSVNSLLGTAKEKIRTLISNNNYQDIHDKLANSRSLEELEHLIEKYNSELEEYEAKGINVAKAISALRYKKGMESVALNQSNDLAYHKFDFQELFNAFIENLQYNLSPNSTAAIHSELTDQDHGYHLSLDEFEVYRRYDALGRMHYDDIPNYLELQNAWQNAWQNTKAFSCNGWDSVTENIHFKKDFEEDGEKYKYQLDVGGYGVRVIDDSAKQDALLRAKVDEYGDVMPELLTWTGNGGFAKGINATRKMVSGIEKIADGAIEADSLAQKVDVIKDVLTNKGSSKAAGEMAVLGKDELIVADKSFLNEKGRIDWDKHAPNGGYVEGTRVDGVTLNEGTVIDRYGSPKGSYTSPVGASYESRALPYTENPNAYHQYRIIKPIENVSMGEIAPAFKQPGGGIQYELPNSIEYLIDKKYLEVIN